MFHLAPCESHGPLSTLLSAPKLFPLLLPQRWLVNYISTWLWSLVAGTQLTITGTQRCPALSWVSVLFLPSDSQTKVPTKYEGDCNSLKAFESPRPIWSIKEGTHSPASRLVSDLSLPQPVAPWGNIRPLSKLPEGWEENASHSECRFMLSSHPKVCVVWMRSGSSLDSELGVSQSPPAGLPPGVTTAGAHPLCLEPKERACSIAFLLLQEGRSADKIRTRLEAQWERNFHFGACRYLRAAQQWMQLSFTSSFPSWKSPSLRTRVPGSQVFTNLSAALEWVQGSVSHLLDEGDWTCSRALVPDWSSVPISGQEAQRWMLLRMLRLPLVGRGM